MIMKTTCRKLSVLVSVTLLFLLLGTAVSTVSGQQKQQEAKQPPQEAKQEKKEQPEVPELPGMITRVFRIRFADPGMLGAQLSTLYRRSVIVIPDLGLRTLTVRATPEVLASIEELIKELDSPAPPRKNIELTVYLLLAAEEQISEAKLPDQLQPVVRQLKNTFAYKGYHLLETLLSRVRDGDGAEMSGLFPIKPADPSATPLRGTRAPYTFNCQSVKLSPDGKPVTVQIDRLRFTASVPLQATPGEIQQIAYRDARIITNIDLREGQIAVVGKTSADGSPNALIIVLTAKVLD